MKSPSEFELPPDLERTFTQAKKMEWITIGYLISTIAVMYLTLGSSQAMKTAWLEDVLSLFPAISFLIASKYYGRRPSKRFPYGYHRVFGIAFFAGAISLFAIGAFMAIDSIITLVKLEHPTIGSVVWFGHQIWMGWIMIVALIYSAIPAILLGRKKMPIAKTLHNKILFTDADAQKADYMTAFAAVIGILGVGLGIWWIDAVAALFISVSVLRDGLKNLKNSVQDLMDRTPLLIDEDKEDPLIAHIEALVKSWDWVKSVNSRFREHGQVYFGEIYVVAHSNSELTSSIEKAVTDIKQRYWQIQDVVIIPVQQLPVW